MTATLVNSHEFAALVKKLQGAPNDPAVKQEVVRLLPEMIALAKVNPLAMYRLAQIHSPTSIQYKQMMCQSAKMGCTNAMLAISQVLMKSSSPADVKTAAHYMLMIERSKDSYIFEQSRDLLNTYPELAAAMKSESRTDINARSHRFFASSLERDIKPEVENQSKLDFA
jgi:hypothetical protein